MTHGILIIISQKIKDNPKSDPKLPKIVDLKTGPRLKLPEITPNEVNNLFMLWIEYFQSVYFSSYLDYFVKRRQDLGQGCQCCPSGSIIHDGSTHILNGFTKFGNLILLLIM